MVKKEKKEKKREVYAGRRHDGSLWDRSRVVYLVRHSQAAPTVSLSLALEGPASYPQCTTEHELERFGVLVILPGTPAVTGNLLCDEWSGFGRSEEVGGRGAPVWRVVAG